MLNNMPSCLVKAAPSSHCQHMSLLMYSHQADRTNRREVRWGASIMSGHLSQDGVYRPAPLPPSHLLLSQPSACHVR